MGINDTWPVDFFPLLCRFFFDRNRHIDGFRGDHDTIFLVIFFGFGSALNGIEGAINYKQYG